MYPFIVNRWSRAASVDGDTSNENGHSTFRALSHAHSDHMQGLESYGGSFFASQMTKDLVLIKYPSIHPERVVALDYDRPYQLNRSMSVTMSDAGHCPGSSMFLYEGNFGSVLHTGDARLEENVFRKLPDRVLSRPGYLDRVFLDATFGGRNVVLSEFPTREQSVDMALKVIYMHPFATHPLVHLNAMMLGTDPLVKALAEYFLVELYCPPTAVGVSRRRELEMTIGDKYVTEDPTSTFMELWDPTVPTRTDAVSIKPSTQYFAKPDSFPGMRQVIEPGIVRDRRDGAYRILFAMHSSRNELRSFLSSVRPRQLTMTAGSLMLR